MVASGVAHVVQYSVVQYSVVHYSSVQYSAVEKSAVEYSAVHYSNVQYSGLYKLFLHPFTQVYIAGFALHTCGEGWIHSAKAPLI